MRRPSVRHVPVPKRGRRKPAATASKSRRARTHCERASRRRRPRPRPTRRRLELLLATRATWTARWRFSTGQVAGRYCGQARRRSVSTTSAASHAARSELDLPAARASPRAQSEKKRRSAEPAFPEPSRGDSSRRPTCAAAAASAPARRGQITPIERDAAAKRRAAIAPAAAVRARVPRHRTIASGRTTRQWPAAGGTAVRSAGARVAYLATKCSPHVDMNEQHLEHACVALAREVSTSGGGRASRSDVGATDTPSMVSTPRRPSATASELPVRKPVDQPPLGPPRKNARAWCERSSTPRTPASRQALQQPAPRACALVPEGHARRQRMCDPRPSTPPRRSPTAVAGA